MCGIYVKNCTQPGRTGTVSCSGLLQLRLGRTPFQGTVQRDLSTEFFMRVTLKCTCSCCCGLFSIMAVPENCRFGPTGLLYLVLNQMQCCMSMSGSDWIGIIFVHPDPYPFVEANDKLNYAQKNFNQYIIQPIHLGYLLNKKDKTL